MSDPNVLASASCHDIAERPFAHLITRDALPSTLYDSLQSSFPPVEMILGGRRAGGDNAVMRRPAQDVLRDRTVAPAWHDFFAYHTSVLFWKDIVRVFGPAIRTTFPYLEDRVGRPLEDFSVGLRGDTATVDLKLDCQFAINTATSGGSSVKTAHVDKRQTVFAGLYYLRDPADKAEGGDLELYAWRRPPRFLTYRMILPEDVELYRSVAYAPNTMVGFVNSQSAVHGVSPRAATVTPRRYINLIAELPFFLFRTPWISVPARLAYWKDARAIRRGSGGHHY